MNYTNTTKEIWKDINGYEGLYQISNLGRVKSLERESSIDRLLKERIMKLCSKNRKYVALSFCKNGKHKTINIHRLVAAAFVDNPNKLPQVNHINGDKLDNRAVNLEWVTNRGNQSHRHKSEKTTSRFTGVYWHTQRKKWTAQIKADGRKRHLGLFTDEVAAAKAYNDALDLYALTNKYKNVIP